MKKWRWTLLVVFGLVLLGALIFDYFGGSSEITNVTGQAAAINDLKPIKPQLGDYLSAVVEFAHQGYLADQQAKDISSNDIAGEMAHMMEQIDDEKLAVSSLSKYASSTDSNISTTAELMVLSETDVIVKQEKALDIMRQLSNGTTPTDYNYVLAQVIASQNKRNDSILQASLLFPYMTIDASNIQASSTATVGPLDPSGALTTDEKLSVRLALQTAFGDNINSNTNDIFLVLAQEINLLLNSPTYTDFHESWLKTVSNMSSDSN